MPDDARACKDSAVIRNRQQRDDAALCLQGASAEAESAGGREGGGREGRESASTALIRNPKPLKAQPVVLGKQAYRSMAETALPEPPRVRSGLRLATRAELYDVGRGHFDAEAVVVSAPETPELADALDHALTVWGAKSV